ncbi:DUF1638 domain-containing protein [Phosphitispora fastidiosa]|uniref:DUF1638 domain-containing protein n=1 Tax=Phosphitispora fastidiosa TaxID=2837202 RepID=UPI001E4CA5AC|nr:hypothetical protein [Phosphitispora fastidiosa]
MKRKLICCDVFKEEINSMGSLPDTDIEFLSMGLHLHPRKLYQEVSQAVARSQGYSRVILGFGLCGGALGGIKAPGCEMIIPRVHDCIPVLLGSKSRYNTLQKNHQGTFYFSGGWVEGDRMMIPEYERSCDQFGPKRALKIFRMMFENYNRLLYIHTGHPRDQATLQKTREFAEILELPCQGTEGDLNYLHQLVCGPWDDRLFVTIAPDQVIDELEFLSPGEQVIVQGC